MEHTLRKLTLNLIAALATTAALPAFCLDVAGVQLGSSLNDAIKPLQAANPKFKFTQISSETGPTGIIAVAKEPRANEFQQVNTVPVDEILVFKAQLANIWFIERQQYLTQEQGFTAETLKTALIKKYGQPSQPDAPSAFEQPGIKEGYMAWAYDRNGKQSFVEYKLAPGTFPENQVVCSYVQLGSKQSPVNDFSTSIQFPFNTTKTCGVILQAYWKSVDGFVKYYSVSAYDVKTLYDFQTNTAMQEEANRKKAFDEQANKKIAPKL
jgi:hypothetical protein